MMGTPTTKTIIAHNPIINHFIYDFFMALFTPA